MKVSLECTYCGHKWIETIYHKSVIDGKTCSHGTCRHKQLIVRDLNDKVDYYKGCPPFPKKEDRWQSYGIE